MPKKEKEKITKPPSQETIDLFEELYSDIESAKDDASTWRDNTDTFYRLRMRFKKTKNFPFAGCSNLRLPTIETYIRKAKAGLLAIYNNIKPRMMVVPQSDGNMEKAQRIEKFLDWVCDTKIHLLEKLAVAVDRMLERGFVLLKVVWRMEDVTKTETIRLDELKPEESSALSDPNVSDDQIIEYVIKKYDIDMSETVADENMENVIKAVNKLRSGEKVVNLEFKDELYNAPDVVVVDPLYAGVPSDSGRDPQSARMIYHEYYEPYNTLKCKARYGILDKEAVDNIDVIKTTSLKDTYLLKNTQEAKEGISVEGNPSDSIKVIDLYRYYDLNNDGYEEKCHFLLAPEYKQVLKKQVLENDSQKFPFVRMDTEIIDDRWYSPRGYPQHLEDTSKEIDAQHNQKIDNQTIRNAPMFVFRSGIINPRLVKFIPGQGIPVPGMTPLDDAIKLLDNQNPNIEFSYEREELLLKTVIQEYLGQVDYSTQSMINKRQPRTLGEVQMQAQAANTVFALDAALFTSALSELFTQILDLCQQYMPERVFTLVTGEDGVEPLHLSRDEIQGKYFIICRGNDMNSNPMLRAQKSLARVQVLLNPLMMQMGVVNPGNAYNILKRYLQDDGELAWKGMISMPKPQLPQPPPAAALIKPQFDELTDLEQAQVLASAGVKPDPQGRALKSNAIIEEKEIERRAQNIDNLSKIFEMENGPQEEATASAGS